jgi:integrase
VGVGHQEPDHECSTERKRQSVPEILTIDELVKLLNTIPEPFRTAVFLDGASGLRVGELLGLKWEDVDFKKSVIYIRRSIVKQRIGPPKTEASQGASALEDENDLQPSQRLGVCKPC